MILTGSYGIHNSLYDLANISEIDLQKSLRIFYLHQYQWIYSDNMTGAYIFGCGAMDG